MVIDFHVHCFNPKIAERAISQLESRSGMVPYTRGLVEQTVERFDEWGVDKGVLLPIATKPTQQVILNDWAAEQDGGRFISFGSIHPNAEDIPQELDRIKAMGLHGIKLHPDYQGFMIDEDRMDAVYDEIERRDLPVIFHAGWDCASPDLVHNPPERAIKMLKKHPHLKVILAHLGANERWQEVYDILAGMDGEVYFDTAFSYNCPDELMVKLIRKHGADRILFASDCPWESSGKMKEKILKLDLSDDEKEKILGENAVRLLDVKG